MNPFAIVAMVRPLIENLEQLPPDAFRVSEEEVTEDGCLKLTLLVKPAARPVLDKIRDIVANLDK